MIANNKEIRHYCRYFLPNLILWSVFQIVARDQWVESQHVTGPMPRPATHKGRSLTPLQKPRAHGQYRTRRQHRLRWNRPSHTAPNTTQNPGVCHRTWENAECVKKITRTHSKYVAPPVYGVLSAQLTKNSLVVTCNSVILDISVSANSSVWMSPHHTSPLAPPGTGHQSR